MPEIHGDNSNSEAIATALRQVSRRGPQAAPRRLGDALLVNFRQHHRHRRAVRAMIAVAVTLTIAGGALLRFGHGNRASGTSVAPAVQPRIVEPRGAKLPVIGGTDHDNAERAVPVAVGPSGIRRTKAAKEVSGKQQMQPFVALPSFAFKAPDEELRVVRVEIPVSALRQLGARVNDELITRRVTAELLIGSDGTPYAFRLIT